MKSILVNIRTIRVSKGYSQEYMAEMMGVSQSAYSNWENGTRDLSYSTLLKISDVLNTPVIDVITYPDSFKKAEAADKEMVVNIMLHGSLNEKLKDILLHLGEIEDTGDNK